MSLTGMLSSFQPTVTSYQGEPGTGIVCLTDFGVGLKACSAVPVNGVLIPLNAPLLAAAGKYIRPVFGDGIVYTSDSAGSGSIYAAGPAQTSQLTCTSPISFGSFAIGNSAIQTINCTVGVKNTQVTSCYTSNPNFQCQNSSLPTAQLAVGTSFSFSLVWNLTAGSIGNSPNSPSVVSPGAAGSILHIETAPIAKYAADTQISVEGTVIDSSPFISITPIHVDVGGIVLGTGSAGLVSSFTIWNKGNAQLMLKGFA
jgi:iron transport multicopper oxidase